MRVENYKPRQQAEAEPPEADDDEARIEAMERRAEGFNATNGAALASEHRPVKMPTLSFLERRFSWEPKGK